MTASGLDLLREALKAFEARDRDRAAELLRRLEIEGPSIGRNWKAASRLAATIGEASTAVSAIRRYVADDPRDRNRRLDYGATLAAAGQVERALEVTRNFIPHVGYDAELLLLIGACGAQLGDTDLAMEAFRTALGQSPFAALAAAIWLAIGDLKTFVAGDPDIEAMQSLRAELADAAPSPLLFALAKAHDDIGDTEAAFALWSQGAAVRRAADPPSPADSAAFVDDLVGRATPQFFAGLAPSGLSGARPIFVLGLPRSGTTLVEQILASHSAVSGGAELNLFRAAAMGLNGFGPDAIAAHQAGFGPQVWNAIGRSYEHLLQERFGPEGRVVDKTLNHSRMLGLIHHVLPEARFVWLRRDPGDNALSCFRSHFADGIEWSWSLEDIAAHFREEDRLHAHWTRAYGDAILSVPYEGLVAEPETWVRRLLDHLGLPFEPGAVDFHKTRRAVTTTSASQVRQPIYTRAVGGWRRYADQMRPFFETYERT